MSLTLATTNAHKAHYETAVLLYNIETGTSRKAIIETKIIKPTQPKLKSVGDK